MKNKNFLYITIISFVCITILSGVFNHVFYKVPQSTIWINNCFLKKDNYAKSISNNKIVFTSGSNTLYGMETETIEKELNIPVVNMAIHAGLKTDYILYRAKNILNKGDIIILPFEYENFIWDGEESDTRTKYVLTHDKNFFINELNLKEKLSMLYSIKPSDLVFSILEQSKPAKEKPIGLAYTSITLNKNGDETYKSGTEKKLYNQQKPFELPLSEVTLGLKKINEFNNWCIKNGIKLFVTYPNIIKQKSFSEDSYKDFFITLSEYFQKHNISIIGKATDSMYPVNYFYDTRYHMNKEGAKVRTNEFLSKLKSHL